MGLTVDSYLLPTSKSRDTETGTKFTNPAPIRFRYCPLTYESVVICQPHHSWGGDSLWKWPIFRLSRARDLDLDLGSGHTAYHHASLIDLYLHTKFHWNRRNFLWTDGRTYARTFFYPYMLLGRLGEVGLKITREWYFTHFPGRPHWCDRAPVGASNAKFCDNRFRGFGILIAPILPFSIGIAGRPYYSVSNTVLHWRM